MQSSDLQYEKVVSLNFTLYMFLAVKPIRIKGEENIQNASKATQVSCLSGCSLYWITFSLKNWKNSGIAGSNMQRAVAKAK